MIILATIQRAEKQTMTDKQDKSKQSDMYQLVLSDATKPAQFRMTTSMIHFTTPDKLRAALGTVDIDELTDMQVTFAASDVAPYNAMLKLKGQLVKGHQTGQQLAAMQASPAPTQPVKPAAK